MKVVRENTQNTLYREFHIVNEIQDRLNNPNANYNDNAEYNRWLRFKAHYILCEHKRNCNLRILATDPQ